MRNIIFRKKRNTKKVHLSATTEDNNDKPFYQFIKLERDIDNENLSIKLGWGYKKENDQELGHMDWPITNIIEALNDIGFNVTYTKEG
jgi:hypothetical protein